MAGVGSVGYDALTSPVARIVVPIRPHAGTSEGALEKYRDLAARHAVFLLRLSLAIVFFWFGVLKVANLSPVAGLLRASIPFLADSPYLQILGIVELTIGTGLLFDRLTKQATVLMILHLLGTLSVLVVSPSVIFAPAFPVLTMAGEFVLKNIVLITAALVIMLARPRVRNFTLQQTIATFPDSSNPRADRHKESRG